MKRLVVSLAVAMAFAACSGGGQDAEKASDKEKSTETKTMENEPVDEAMPVIPQDVTLEVHAVGESMTEMKFEPKRLEVPAGANVTVTLVNKASSEAMIHNFVVIKAGSQEEVNEQAMKAGSDKDYIPENDNIIAATSMAQPGETVEVEFTAPTEPGTYQFICTYPGHAAMKGIFLVK